MHGHPTPLVLVVSEDPKRVYRVRTELRRDGFLPAFGRSTAMAAALFAQIRIEAVVIFPGDALGELAPLQQAIHHAGGLPTLYLAEAAPFPDWTACAEEQIAPLLREALGLVP